MQQISFKVDNKLRRKKDAVFKFYGIDGKDDSEKCKNLIIELHKQLEAYSSNHSVTRRGVPTRVNDIYRRLKIEVEQEFKEQNKTNEYLNSEEAFYCACARALQRYSKKRKKHNIKK